MMDWMSLRCPHTKLLYLHVQQICKHIHELRHCLMTDMTDNLMHPKGGIHNTQSRVINLTVHSEGLSLHIVSGAYLLHCLN